MTAFVADITGGLLAVAPLSAAQIIALTIAVLH